MHGPEVGVAQHDEGAFDTWLRKWFDAEPAVRVVRLFVADARNPGVEALMCLAYELSDAAFGVRDPGVAQAKLGWWLEELAELEAGRARHPIARRLAECGAADALSEGIGAAAVAGAAAIARVESPGSVTDLLEVVVRMEAPLARARTRLLRADVAPAVVTALAAARVADAVTRWSSFAAPERARIPLDVLARIGTDRERAQRDPVAAPAAVRAMAQELGSRVAVDADSALDRALLARARAQLAILERQPRRAMGGGIRPGWRMVVAVWRAARRRSTDR